MAFWKRLFGGSPLGLDGPHSPEMESILEGLTGEPAPGEAPRRVALCERALQILDKDDNPKLWAFLKREMALRLLSLIEGDRAVNVERAIEALKDALTVRTRERMPEVWARTRSNLANAYSDRIYGDRAENMECTIAGLQEILEVRTRKVAPMEWAGTQMDLAIAFSNRLRGDLVENQERSIQGYQAALEVWNPTDHPSDWAAAQTNLAITLCHRIRGSRAENIENAIAGFERALEAQAKAKLSPSRKQEAVSSLNLNLAHAYLERIQGSRSQNVEQAIRHCEAALELLSPGVMPVEWADAQISLANALLERSEGDRSTNIEAAIKHYIPAMEVLTPSGTPQLWAGAKVNLANAYLARLGDNSPDHVERAISLCREVLAVVPSAAMPKEWGSAQMALGHALINRADGDHAENVEQAIVCYEAALTVRSEEQTPLSRAGLHVNLANAYMERVRGDREENRQQAIKYYQEALKVFSRENNPFDWALTQANLATAYSTTGAGYAAELDRSIEACEAALQVYTREETPYKWADTVTNLANALMDTHDAEKVERAIEVHRSALEVWTRNASLVRWALCQENLASAYQQRIHGDRADNLRLAEAACRAALEVLTADALPGAYVKVQGRLGNILFDQARWKESAASFLLATQTRDLLYRTAATEEVRHDLLGKFGAMDHRLAFALAQEGGQENLRQAAFALERGRGRAVADYLSEEILSFDGVESSDRRDFEHARREVEALRSKARAAELTRDEYLKIIKELRGAHKKLNEAVTRIRAYVPEFFAETDWENISEAARLTPLLYLIATDLGGFGILVTRDEAVRSIPLPGLVWPTLIDKTLKYLPALYEGDIGKRLDSLDELLRWLWNNVMGRLVEALDGEKEVLVIAGGMISLLPLHAAWRFDEQEPAKRRYAMDALTFRYAPNALSFLAAYRTAARIKHDKVLAVANPSPTRLQPLPGAESEIECLLRHFGDRATVLRGAEATREAVLGMLPEFSVLHFACHGRVTPAHPLDNGLYMAYDQLLTLRDLLALRLTNVRLAVLSACDTAVTGIALPDEVFGLPAGLMIAGVDGVVGALWQVADASGMLLMAQFYDGRVGNGLEPSEALAKAQRWMSETTVAEKDEYFRANFAWPGAADTESIAESLDADSQHPYFWASFCYTGV